MYWQLHLRPSIMYWTSIMESSNSVLNPYGRALSTSTPVVHEFSKKKILDHQCAFMVLKQTKNNENPRWSPSQMRLPILRYLRNPSGLFDQWIWLLHMLNILVHTIRKFYNVFIWKQLLGNYSIFKIWYMHMHIIICIWNCI